MHITFKPKKQSLPTIENGIRLPYAPAYRARYKFRGYMLLIFIFTPVVLLSYHLFSDKIFITAPGIVTTEPMEIRSSGSGFVDKILINTGDYVNKGKKLATIINPLLDTRVKTLYLVRDQTSHQLDDLDQAVLKELKNAYDVAKNGLKEQLEISNKFKDAAKYGILPTIHLATISNSLTASRLVVRSAKTELERERRIQQLDLMTSPLMQHRRTLLLDIAEAQSRVATLQPISKASAIVAEILVREGDWVKESTPLFLLTQRRKPFVHTFLDARYASQCIDGTEVTIVLPSGVEMNGKISGQTVLARRLPTGLAKPFGADKPALKVTVIFTEKAKFSLVENLPVTVKFPHLGVNTPSIELKFKQLSENLLAYF